MSSVRSLPAWPVIATLAWLAIGGVTTGAQRVRPSPAIDWAAVQAALDRAGF